MSPLASGRRDDYVRLLVIQHAARTPIEAFLGRGKLPDNLASIPPQAPLLAADLADLGIDTGRDGRFAGFELAQEDNPLGLCWLLAGSSMGNRMILSRLRKHDADLPTRFLADPEMPRYWRTLLPELEREVSVDEAEPAVRAAIQGFHHFLAFARQHAKEAA